MNNVPEIRNKGELIACRDCDLLHHAKDDAGSEQCTHTIVARCRRCGGVLYRRKCNSLERTLALTLASLILFMLANTFPFMAFEMGVQIRETNLITGIIEFYEQGWPALAALVMMTTIIAPLVQCIGMIYILLPLQADRPPPKFTHVFRMVRGIQQWSMLEIFMLGILISLVKLSKMADIVPGVALFAFMGLIITQAAAVNILDPDMVWKRWRPNP